MLHSKSSEAIRSLYVKKRVKHKVLIAEKWSRSVNALTSYSKRYSRPVAWRNRSRDPQEQWHFTTKADVRLLLAAFFEFTHRDCSGDGDRVYSSHKSIDLPRKTWNINHFWINYDGSCVCLLYLLFYWQMVGLGAGVGLRAHKCVM